MPCLPVEIELDEAAVSSVVVKDRMPVRTLTAEPFCNTKVIAQVEPQKRA